MGTQRNAFAEGEVDAGQEALDQRQQGGQGGGGRHRDDHGAHTAPRNGQVGDQKVGQHHHCVLADADEGVVERRRQHRPEQHDQHEHRQRQHVRRVGQRDAVAKRAVQPGQCGEPGEHLRQRQRADATGRVGAEQPDDLRHHGQHQPDQRRQHHHRRDHQAGHRQQHRPSARQHRQRGGHCQQGCEGQQHAPGTSAAGLGVQGTRGLRVCHAGTASGVSAQGHLDARRRQRAKPAAGR